MQISIFAAMKGRHFHTLRVFYYLSHTSGGAFSPGEFARVRRRCSGVPRPQHPTAGRDARREVRPRHDPLCAPPTGRERRFAAPSTARRRPTTERTGSGPATRVSNPLKATLAVRPTRKSRLAFRRVSDSSPAAIPRECAFLPGYSIASLWCEMVESGVDCRGHRETVCDYRTHQRLDSRVPESISRAARWRAYPPSGGRRHCSLLSHTEQNRGKGLRRSDVTRPEAVQSFDEWRDEFPPADRRCGCGRVELRNGHERRDDSIHRDRVQKRERNRFAGLDSTSQ